ncbi:hypothetical protein HN924_01840 [Candidatus Woesearchaeota archaeon]|jgi:hypothetical protein|nr:hypothetical protein [Candidatus Woesearchaeota archaeon]MBT7062690.1 hypothetical protein [Candidatus Woesearchaeota archaeon]
MKELSKTAKMDCLKQYMEFEALYSELFKKVNFCGPNCTSKEYSLYFVKKVRGDVGCCSEDHFLTKIDKIHNNLLSEKRIEKYGLPNNQEEPYFDNKKPCAYHTPKGCILEDLKPHVCVAFTCYSFSHGLERGYELAYDYEEIRNNLEAVLNGELSEENIRLSRIRLLKSIEIVEKSTNF